MPVYNFECRHCGDPLFEILCKHNERDIQRCPFCGELATPTYTPTNMMLVGAAPSKPITVGGANKAFETNTEYRKYLKDNPNVKIVDPKDSEFKRYKDRVNDDANKMAKRGGYSDIDHMRRERRKEAQRKKELGS